jgi:hypothetical protein
VTEMGSQPEESSQQTGGRSAGGQHGRKFSPGGMVNRHRRSLMAVAGVVVLVLAGTVYVVVRSGAAPAAGPVNRQKPSASASAPACAPGASVVPPGQPPVALDKKHIGRATLTAGDFPSGWRSRPSSGGAASGFRSGYPPLDKLIGSVAGTPHKGVRFAQGTSGPLLEEFVAVSTAAQAGNTVRTFAATSQQCTTFLQPAVKGKRNRVSVSPLGVRVQGDEASAIKLTVRTSSGLTAIDVATTRLGNTLVVAYFAHIGNADSDLLGKLLGKAVVRVQKSAGQ